MKLRYVLIVLTLVFAHEAFSQSYLVLRKQGTMRKFEFFAGDQFIYRMKGQDIFFKDRVADFADSTIILQNNILHLSQLEEVDVRNASSNRSEFLRSMENYLPVVGYGYFAIDFFNVAVVEGEKYTIDNGVAIWSAAMVGTGYGLKFMRKKIFKLHKPRREAFIVGL